MSPGSGRDRAPAQHRAGIPDRGERGSGRGAVCVSSPRPSLGWASAELASGIERKNMRFKLTRISKSRGNSKRFIAQRGVGDVVEARVLPECLVVAPHRARRCGWKRAFAAPHLGEPILLDQVLPNEFDLVDWEW